MQKKILIAEDDQAILEVLKSILEGEGHLVFSPRNERAIHEIVRQESPDLILLDIWLLGHDGGKIAKDLKGKDETKNIPIIMMSANNETEKISREVGADGFLLKPFTIEDLQTVITKFSK
jgi:DNA-binding response OmpR family regulator